MKEIITSIFAYKSQLYLSSLDGSIAQLDIQSKYGFRRFNRNEQVIFNVNKYFDNTIILDIKAYKNKFYILTRNGLYKYYDSIVEKLKDIEDAQVMALDIKKKILFLVSDSRGLIGINLERDNYIDDIRLPIFEKNDLVPITSISADNGIIFLSILNAGIYRIDYKNKKYGFQYKKFQKIKLNNPQDVFFNKNDNELAVVDYDYGVVIINIINGDVQNYKLPNNDIPNSIKMIKSFDRKYYIIQSRKGLYKFDMRVKEFHKIFDERVSNITTYFNEIFFTNKGILKRKFL